MPRRRLTLAARKLLLAWLDRSQMSRREFARLIGIKPPYLSQILLGDRRPGLDILARIMDVTGIPVRAWSDTSASVLAQVTESQSKNVNVCNADRAIAVG